MIITGIITIKNTNMENTKFSIKVTGTKKDWQSSVLVKSNLKMDRSTKVKLEANLSMEKAE